MSTIAACPWEITICRQKKGENNVQPLLLQGKGKIYGANFGFIKEKAYRVIRLFALLTLVAVE